MAQADKSTAAGRRLRELLSPEVWKALADPNRIGILVRLAEGGRPRTVGEIAAGTELDLSVVSRHLATLRASGFVACEKRGKEVWCSVRSGQMILLLREVADALEACCPPAEPARPRRRRS